MTTPGHGFHSVYRKSVLPNGIRVVTEYVPHVRSLTIGLWVRSGSRHERVEQNGIAHFLEHMVFKGTRSRTAYQIAQSIESLGGYLNAFTGRELNCYLARLLDVHAPVAIDVLADILQHSLFDPDEVEKEKHVVIDEIKGMEDNPEEWLHDQFTSLIWQPHPLGRSILGTEATVSALTREEIRAYLDTYYTADRTTVVAAGNVDHDQIVELVRQTLLFPDRPAADPPAVLSPPAARCQVTTKDIAQAHLCVGGHGLPFRDERKYALFVLNAALGGGMTSRLFQAVREKAGLAYSIYSDLDFYEDTGLFSIYAGTDGADVPRVLEMIYTECARLRQEPLHEDELQDSKSQLTGGLILSMENTGTVMNRLARLELYLDSYSSIDETIAQVDAVTLTQVQELAEELLDPERLSVAALGPVEERDVPLPR
ncbi:MAG: insulinase family protein [Candidatus Latescibacteria bacterium]|nr:insulinase family protein [Candidatus Latescibacterota bacterium]